MWPFRKKTNFTVKTSAAVAYLKACVPTDVTSPALELPYDDSPVMKEIGYDLVVAYLVDQGKSFEYIQNRHLKADSLTASKLHEIGLQNLMAIAASGNLRVVPYGSIYAVLLDGNFEASMILLDTLWAESFRQFVRGDYLIALPTRDVLAFCDASSDIGRTELLEMMNRLDGSASHTLTRRLYVRNDKVWMPENAD